MKCNYYDYKTMVDTLFSTTLSEERQNNITEEIRRYLVDGGAGHLLVHLGIGIRKEEKTCSAFDELNEVLRFRFVWFKGPRNGELLTIDEIKSIGMWLPQGSFYESENIMFRDSYEAAVLWVEEDFKKFLSDNGIPVLQKYVQRLISESKRNMEDTGVAAGWEAMESALHGLQQKGEIPLNESS